MENEEQIKEALSYSLAADLHEIWRKNRKLEDGSFKPSYRKSKDEEWNITHGKNEADIANLSFKELPFNCQIEKLEEPKIIIDLIFNKAMTDEPFNQQEIDKISSDFHEKWKENNKWSIDPIYGEPELDVSFEKLPEKKKEEYHYRVIHAIEKVKAYKDGKIDINTICEEYGLATKSKSR